MATGEACGGCVDRHGCEVVLIRHGRTAANADRRIVGALDVPLDEVGHAQAKQLAGAWPHGAFDLLVTSPMTRARQTASYLGAPGAVLDGLREMHQGILEGMAVDAAFAAHGDVFLAVRDDPERAVIPGGESLGQVRDRAVAALDVLAARHPGGRVVCVTHQMVVASVAACAAGAPLRDWRRFVVDNTGARVLRRDAGGWRLVA